ncbi:ATP-binding protein [Streptomyces beijiangensis]|uniref:ATP-binding protein n=1 Tax=Streptomyces beijiangensis TaxID=163361 RepID=UPI0031DF5289
MTTQRTAPPAPLPSPEDVFELRFTSTRRGARLARRLASHRVHTWGHAYGTEANDTVSLIVGELAANAVLHGTVPGRDALLRLLRTGDRIRVEVSDTRGERQPAPAPSENDCSGRGQLIVAALAEAWDVSPREGAPGKTVWALVRTTGR